MDEQGDTGLQDRVEELLAGMSVAEKAGQLTQYFSFKLPEPEEGQGGIEVGADQPGAVQSALERGGAGALLFVTDPAEINRLQRIAVERGPHGVPVLFGFDVIHGLRTIFPVPIAMAASWDLDVIERGQAVAAREARAVGITWTFAPMVDIARDPRWGRIIEGAGEDPFLGAAVAAAQVRGFQGKHLGTPEHVIAGPKHFAGYGFGIGGRDYDESDVSDSTLWNVVFPPFKAAIDAGAGNVMTAYQDLNGIPLTGNHRMLTEVLRDTWGFTGFVVSDANAVRNLLVHGFAKDHADAAVRAVSAGTDVEMAVGDPAFDHLAEAVESGRLDEGVLDTSARRVLEAKLRMGLFDDPYVDEDRARQVLADPVHREVAREAAERSAVLLKNDGDLLPLGSGVGSIAVLGPLADSRRDTLGPWVFDFDLDETVTVAAGLRARAGDGLRVEYAPGVPVAQRTFPSMFDMFGGNTPEDPPGFDSETEFDRAVRLAADADVAVVVLGEWQNMIGEAASRATLDLPGRQLELLQAVVATGTPTVLVLLNGRPLDLRWPAEHVPAILDVWYPGTRGGDAVARLLLGDAVPGGKLPFNWPRSVGQVPMPYAHTVSHEPENQERRYWDEASTPLWPFGYGLSYARFRYEGLAVDRTSTTPEGTVAVSVDVVNESERDGVEVAQLYLHQRYGTASRPVRELKGFERVEVPAGGSVRVEFTIGPDERRYWNAAARDWLLDASTFDVWVGTDSSAALHGEFEVTD